MRRAWILLGFLACVSCASSAPDDPMARARQYYLESLAAQGEGDFGLARDRLEKAFALRPHHPTLLLELAGACARSGDSPAALDRLALLAEMGIHVELGEAFSGLRDDPELPGIRAALEANTRPVGSSEVSFRVPGDRFIPEGLAFDSRDGAFYLGSVREGRILRVLGDAVEPFAGPKDGLWSVFGMRVDPVRRHLWVCTSAAPNFEGVQDEDRGATAVVRFDLDRPQRRMRFELRTPGAESWFGDLALSPSGDVFLTDSRGGGVYVIRGGNSELQPVVAGGIFPSPQGIAVTEDAATLFVADYSRGIYRIDVATGAFRLLPYPMNATLLGIDGLYLHDHELIAIQNGTQPHRIVRASMNAARDEITGVRVFLSNLEGWSEPTLGVVVGREFHYVANSQWWAFDEDGNLPADADLRPPLILRSAL